MKLNNTALKAKALAEARRKTKPKMNPSSGFVLDAEQAARDLADASANVLGTVKRSLSDVRKILEEGQRGDSIDAGDAKKHQAKSVGARTRKPEVDPNTMFDLVKKHGGYQAVGDLLEERGLLNPKTRKPYTKASIKRFCRDADGFAEWQVARQNEYKTFGEKLKEINEEAPDASK